MNATEIYRMKIDILRIQNGNVPKQKIWQTDDNGDWITINGTHVQLSDKGEIKKGPKSLKDWQQNKKNEKNSPLKSQTFDDFEKNFYSKYQKAGMTKFQAEQKLREEKGWDDRAMPLETAYYQSIGYTEKPEVQRNDVIGKMIQEGCVPIYRGLQSTTEKSASRMSAEFQVLSPEAFTVSSENVFGSGTYFDTDPNVAKQYSDGSPGSVICGCLKKDAKIVSLSELQEKTKKSKTADLGMIAAEMGYDAIDCSSEGPTHIVLLNRGAAVVSNSNRGPEDLEANVEYYKEHPEEKPFGYKK